MDFIFVPVKWLLHHVHPLLALWLSVLYLTLLFGLLSAPIYFLVEFLAGNSAKEE